MCVCAVAYFPWASGVLLKEGPCCWVLCFCLRLVTKTKTKKPKPPTDWTDFNFLPPSGPESETSKMLCVSNASLIMQIHLSPKQVKPAFVELCVRARVCLHDLRKPK